MANQVSHKPLKEDREDDESVGYVMEYDEEVLSVRVNKDGGDVFILMEFEYEFIMWMHEGDFEAAGMHPERDDVVVVVGDYNDDG